MPGRSSIASKDFEVELVRQAWGIKLADDERARAGLRRRRNDPRHQRAPVRRAARRDLHIHEIIESGRFDLDNPAAITNAVFHVLRNARHPRFQNLRPTWWSAGAAIRSTREDTSTPRRSGYELGLRGLDVCTGCGPGAMKGPDEGRDHRPCQAAHRRWPLSSASPSPRSSRPEPPNPIVNQLVIMPDIEKRLGALRSARARHRGVSRGRGHGGGNPLPARHPARARELRRRPLKVVLTGPGSTAGHFVQIKRFIAGTLGEKGGGSSARHRRRSGRGGALHGYRHGKCARLPSCQQRLPLTQLAAENPPAFQHPFEVSA